MTDKVENFYDDFSEFQLNSGLHERHYLMHEKLIEIGMNKHSSLLEIGAGIGMITSLIRKTVSQGPIVVNDISPKSLELNEKVNRQSNIEFKAGDILNLDLNSKFDFITLFDVLEHIPIDLHPELFEKFSELLSDEGVLFINIPTPECLAYHIEHEKEVLQIIDQPLPANKILNHAYGNGFILFFFETYDLWHMRDYQMMMFRKAYNWNKIPVIEKYSIKKKISKSLASIKNVIARDKQKTQ